MHFLIDSLGKVANTFMNDVIQILLFFFLTHTQKKPLLILNLSSICMVPKTFLPYFPKAHEVLWTVGFCLRRFLPGI